MTRQIALTAVVLLAGLATGDVLACGDKFLVPGRGVRFELTPAARQQAAVLFYVNPASSLPAVFAKLGVDPAVRKAGYRPTVVSTADELDRTLRQRPWDVVLVDLADSAGRDLSSAAGAPAVVVLTVNSKSPDLKRAQKQYAAVLKSPTRSQSVVDVLDVAVANVRTARARAAKKSL